MRECALMIVMSLIAVTTATAGKNAGGALVVHTDDAYGFYRSFCEDFEDWVPQDCELLNTRTDHEWGISSLIWFIAAFDSSSNPGVTSIYFGNDHNLPIYYHNRWGFCGPAGTIEHADPGWPDSPMHAGIWVEFGSPIVNDRFFPFYRVDVWGFEDAYYGPGIHPVLGYAAFLDDSDPPKIDEVSRFGQVRWYHSGYNECPGSDPMDLIACCFDDGDCQRALEAECIDLGGESLGPGTNCDPNPCPQLNRGVCCLDTGECRLKKLPECTQIGGTFLAEETACDPNPCPQPALGACCLYHDGCVVTTEPACSDIDGTFLEGIAVCMPDPCRAACCLPSGECQVESPYGCGWEDGEYMGPFSVCDPNPCVNSDVPEMLILEATWGSIKARYR